MSTQKCRQGKNVSVGKKLSRIKLRYNSKISMSRCRGENVSTKMSDEKMSTDKIVKLLSLSPHKIRPRKCRPRTRCVAGNVCVCAVVGFRSRHCPRGQTLNEDNTYSLHVTPPLRKHFVMQRAVLTLYLTTRMPELGLCVGMCGSGIGVVFEGEKLSKSNVNLDYCQSILIICLF
jgi:hypothetical protein